MAFVDVAAQVSEGGGPVALRLRLSEALSEAVVVELSFGGSASAVDYTVDGTPFVIAPGDTSARVTITPTPDGMQEPSETIEVTIASVIGAEIGNPAGAVLTIAGTPELGLWGDVVFSTNALIGPQRIYSATLDEGRIERVTDTPLLDWRIALAPDQRQVAFVTGGLTSPRVVVANEVAGTETVVSGTLLASIASDQPWSPDGALVSFVASGGPFTESVLWTAAANGDSIYPMSDPAVAELSGADDRAWSPTGTHLAFIARAPGDPVRRVFTVRSDGSELQEFAADPAGRDVTSFRWSPNGASIAFTNNPPLFEPAELFVKALDDPHAERVGTVELAFDQQQEYVWVPDSSGLVSRRPGSTGNSQRLFFTSIPALQDQSNSSGGSRTLEGWRLSPDAGHVAYIAFSPSSGLNELFVEPLGGGAPIRIPAAASGAGSALSFQWSPDSGYLAFTVRVGFSRDLQVARRDGTGATSISGTASSGDFRPTEAYAWDPDSQRVAFIGSRMDAMFNTETILAVRTRDAGPLTTVSGPHLSVVNGVLAALHDFNWSSDSAWLIYTLGDGDQFSPGYNTLLAARSDGTGAEISLEVDTSSVGFPQVEVRSP